MQRRPKVLVGGHLKPHGGFTVVLPDAITFVGHDSEIMLRLCQTLISGQAAPLRRRNNISGDAFTLAVNLGQAELGAGIALFRQ